jgi:hypothetical protein
LVFQGNILTINTLIRSNTLIWIISGVLAVAGIALAAHALLTFDEAEVIVEWTTASELDTVGFNLLRGETSIGPFEQVNSELIPTAGDLLTGSSYTYEDRNALAGITYFYMLEEVESTGSTNQYGPTIVEAKSPAKTKLLVAGLLIGGAIIYAAILLRKPEPQGAHLSNCMNLPPSTDRTNIFSLGIAHFTLRVECDHSRLAKTLEARYADFPPGQQAAFTARVDWVGSERSSSLLDTNTNFQDGVLHFSAPGYQGFIDEKAKRGYLRLSSAQPVEDIDYFLRVVLALLVHQAGGILMHTAAIVRNGRAYLFFGHSGSGKTTVCRVSDANYKILNDDLILLLPQGKSWLAHGTPFWNPTQTKPTNQSAPVAGMYLLTQDTRVYVQELAPGKATAALISNVPVIPQDPVRSIPLLEALAQLHKNTPVYELHFLPDDSFWDVIPD